MLALEENDPKQALESFDESFWGHIAHSLKTFFRAWGTSWSFGLFGPAPDEGPVKLYYRQLGRYAAAFAVMADVALLLLGGGLKRKEMLSARFGDILSELYFLSAVLKRWKDEGHPEADLPLVHFTLRRGLAAIEQRMDAIFRNLPVRPAAWLLRFFLLPFGVSRAGPPDKLVRRCAELLLEPSAVRDRLTAGLFLEAGANSSIAELEQAFELTCELQPLTERIRDARCSGAGEALEKGLITDAEAKRLKEAEELVARVIAVDDFPAEDLGELNYSINPDADTDEEQ